MELAFATSKPTPLKMDYGVRTLLQVPVCATLPIHRSLALSRTIWLSAARLVQVLQPWKPPQLRPKPSRQLSRVSQLWIALGECDARFRLLLTPRLFQFTLKPCRVEERPLLRPPQTLEIRRTSVGRMWTFPIWLLCNLMVFGTALRLRAPSLVNLTSCRPCRRQH